MGHYHGIPEKVPADVARSFDCQSSLVMSGVTLYDIVNFSALFCSSDAGPRSAVIGPLTRPYPTSNRNAMSDTEGSRVCRQIVCERANQQNCASFPLSN